MLGSEPSTDGDLRRMGRRELVEIIYALQKNDADQAQQIERLKTQLRNRAIAVEKAGSIADAALVLNGVFERAQEAADQYLASVASQQEQATAEADRIVETARQTASRMIEEAAQRAEDLEQQAQAKARTIVQEAENHAKQTNEQAERTLQEANKVLEGVKSLTAETSK